MHVEKISKKEARKILLTSQKLVGSELNPQQIIEHLGYIQIDTISVVERAHHHVFWSRNSKYKPSDLDDLIRSRKAFEYWSHAASFLPMKDYRFSIPVKTEFAKKMATRSSLDRKLMKEVLNRIQQEGPLRSKDFEVAGGTKGSGWWEHKPTKKALERLFIEGQLEIARREKFQKFFDIPERVIPSSVDTSTPTNSEFIRYLIERTLRHHGLANATEIGYLQKKNIKDDIQRELGIMVESGEVVEVSVEKIEEPYFAMADVLETQPRMSSKILILSPFDNLIIQRKKLKRFFDYDYQIECYVPEGKRKYGYFCLPVFQGPKPLARIDCKVDRKNKNLSVKSIFYEKGVDKDSLRDRLNKKLLSFAKFNGCNQFEFQNRNDQR